MKCITIHIIFLSFICGLNTYAQSEGEFQKKFEAANQFTDQRQYEIAKDLWIELTKEYPDNANLNFKAGYCLLNTYFQKRDALEYLIKAELNIKDKYSPIDYTINHAPLETHYYLASAYHYNYQIDSAIKYYRYFQNKGPKKHYLQDNVANKLKQCKIASSLILNRKDYELVNLGEEINSDFPDYNPCLTLDENVLFFTSKRTRSDKNAVLNNTIFNPKDGQHFEDIYVSYKNVKTNKWSKPKLLEFCSPDESQATISISGDGEKLFVYQSIYDNDEEIYYTSRDQDYYKLKPLNIFNSPSWENHVTISADEKTLFFVSDRPGGLGGTDIWRCLKLPNGEWSQPYNIGPPVNSPYNEQSPFIHPDGKTLYFSSNGEYSMGGYDIFFSKKIDNTKWSNPVNLGFPLNTVDDDLFFTTSADGERGYYASNHDGGYGGNDLYMVKFKNTKTDPVTILKGYVDKGDNQLLPDGVTVWVHEVGSEMESLRFSPNKNNGTFVFILEPCKEYQVEYTKIVINSSGELEEKSFYHQSFKVPCESNFKNIQKSIVIPGIDLNGNVVYEEENKINHSLINEQPIIKFSQLVNSAKKLINLTLLDKNGNTIQKALLTEDRFKFVLLNEMNEYKFMISNFPKKLDLSDIPIEIFTKNFEMRLSGDFTNSQSFKYTSNNEELSDRSILKNKIYFERTFDYNHKPSSVSELEFKSFIAKVEELILQNGYVKIEIIGSSSKVPTNSYTSNLELAKARVEDAKQMIFRKIDALKIDRRNVRIIKELPIVDGPEFNNDVLNKSKYSKYEYIRIIAKFP